MKCFLKHTKQSVNYFLQYMQEMAISIIFGGVSLERNIISLLVIVLVIQLVAGMILAIKGMAKGRGSSVVKVV